MMALYFRRLAEGAVVGQVSWQNVMDQYADHWGPRALTRVAQTLLEKDLHLAPPTNTEDVIHRFRRFVLDYGAGQQAQVLRFDNLARLLYEPVQHQHFMVWFFIEALYLWKQTVDLPSHLIDHVRIEHFSDMDAVFGIIGFEAGKPVLLGNLGLAGGRPLGWGRSGERLSVPTIYFSSADFHPAIRSNPQARSILLGILHWRSALLGDKQTYFNVVTRTCSPRVLKLFEQVVAEMGLTSFSHGGTDPSAIPDTHQVSLSWAMTQALGQDYYPGQPLFVPNAGFMDVNFHKDLPLDPAVIAEHLRHYGITQPGQTLLCVTIPLDNPRLMQFFRAYEAQKIQRWPLLNLSQVE